MKPLNPVLRRELLERWRSRRAVVTVTIYLAVLGLALWLLYRIGVAVLAPELGFFGGGADPGVAGPMLGRFLLEGLLAAVLLGVLFVAPGYAAGQLAGERERRTLPLLQTTLLRPSQIVFGKLGASVAWLGLLVVATLPLGAAAFFLGGVSVGDLVRGVVYILVVAVSVAAMALGFSSLTKRTIGAIVLTYGLVLALTFGTLFAALAEFVLSARTAGFERTTPISLYLNPMFGLSDAVRARRPSEEFAFGPLLPSPLGLMAEALPRRDRMAFDRGVMIEPGVEMMPPPGFGEFAEPMPEPGFDFVEELDEEEDREPVWLIVMGLYAGLGSLGLIVATARVRRTDVTPRGRAGRPADGGDWPPPAVVAPGAAPSAAAAEPGPGGHP